MAEIVLIGAGSAQFGFETLGDMFSTPALKGSRITLLDIDKKALQYVHKTAKDFLQKNDLPFTLRATTDRETALKGAEFVIISIEVGDRFLLWDMDRTIPQQYGIEQVYGENGGPGGLFHSLRIIPPILDICADVRRLCPDAFVFNYSNPMSRICTTVHRRFPDLKFIGLCHEIASLERYLPPMLGIPFEDLELTAGGLNHFSVLLKAVSKKTGKSVYGDIRRKAPAFFAKLPDGGDFLKLRVEEGILTDTEGAREMSEVKASRAWGERKLFKFVLENFNLLPITSDSHFGEYLAWAYDVADHKGIMDFYRYYRIFLGNCPPVIEQKRKERVTFLIEGILSDSGYEESAVNIPNKGMPGSSNDTGAIRELPDWIAVEVPARIKASGPDPICLPKLSPAYAGLLRNQVAVHDLTAEAVLKKSKKAVLQALLVDPVVTRAARLEEMVNIFIDSQKDYLGYLR